MKKNSFVFILFLIIGLVVGIILGELLSPVKALWFLTKSVPISWEPKADLQVLKYDFYIEIKLNLCAIIGVVTAFFVYRRF